MSDTHTGTCLCGAVTIRVQGAPIVEGFCHCNDCRAWSATPVTPYGLWLGDQVSFPEGEDLVDRYSKTGDTIRLSCAACGSLLGAELPAIGMVDVFPMRLQGRAFKPEGHIHYASRVMDIDDDLPKYADLPADAGGSGKMIEA